MIDPQSLTGRDIKNIIAYHRFHFPMETEISLRNILGGKAYHSAGMNSPRYGKKYFVDAIKALEKRSIDVLNRDERIRERTEHLFTRLKNVLKDYDKRFNESIIISTLLEIISRLLGYDWLTGETYRTPVFASTVREEYDQLQNRLSGGYDGRASELIDTGVQRVRIAKELRESGNTINSISRILGCSEYSVRQILDFAIVDKIASLRTAGKDESEIIAIIRQEFNWETAYDSIRQIENFGIFSSEQ